MMLSVTQYETVLVLVEVSLLMSISCLSKLACLINVVA